MIKAIYKISSKSDRSVLYIGGSTNYRIRKNGHFASLKRGSHHSKSMQKHFNELGANDLEASIIVVLDEQDDLLKFEQYFLDLIKPCFNTSFIAGSTKGIKYSEDVRRKMSERNKGIAPNYILTDEIRRKMSESRKKRITKQETREKMKARMTGENNHLFGKKHTEETIQKMREVKIGKKMSDEAKEKHRQRMIGKSYSKKAVIDTVTGNKYNSAKEAAEQNGMNISTLQAMLSGRNPNKTNLRYF